MIEAKDLRIGNLVWSVYDNIDYCIQAPDILCLWEGMDSEVFQPIPLTEEWLLRFGFESNSYQDRYENNAIHIECNKTRGFTELWIESIPHIKYIHQLQNLYFALTGKELELK